MPLARLHSYPKLTVRGQQRFRGDIAEWGLPPEIRE